MADGSLNERSLLRRALAVAIVLVLAVPGCGKSGDAAGSGSTTQDKPADNTPTTQTVEINGHTFELELALDDDAREQGLSDRKQIAEDGGMLFVFRHPVRTQFVMRRCYVPIDLVFIDDDGYIDTLHRMEVIEPVGGPQWHNPSTGYPSAGAIQFVIELKGGTLDKLKLRRGDRIDLPREKLQSMAQ
ncbi:MAG: DUF192 domain-containing protein [Phycisphaeraceae bacterium]